MSDRMSVRWNVFHINCISECFTDRMAYHGISSVREGQLMGISGRECYFCVKLCPLLVDPIKWNMLDSQLTISSHLLYLFSFYSVLFVEESDFQNVPLFLSSHCDLLFTDLASCLCHPMDVARVTAKRLMHAL